MPEQTLVEMLRSGAAAHPDANLYQCGGAWQSYAKMDHASDLMAGALASRDVRPGDRVATISTNRIEMVVAMFACSKLGAIQVPLNPFLKGEFLRHQLTDSGACLLLADAAGVPTAGPILDGTSVTTVVCLDGDDGAESARATGVATVSYDDVVAGAEPFPGAVPSLSDTFSIIYTSGTTGLPKGCVISNGYLLNSPRQWQAVGWLRPGDVQFTALPLFHTGGQNIVVGAVLAGAPAVIEPRFSASTYIARAAQERATLLRGVGSMALAVLRQPAEPDDAEHGFRQASFPPLSAEKRSEFEQRFGIVINNQLYGQTECIPATIEPKDGPSRPDSCGAPAPGIELRIVDDEDEAVPTGSIGEIVVRPQTRYSVFSGYWNNPSATLEVWRGLWHHTGDYGRFDDDGYVYFVDRKKDALRRRGENVSSMELESAIRLHPAVVNAAVIAVASNMGEDDIKVFIVLDDEVTAPDASEFFDFCKRTLPYFAMPRWVVRVRELPLTQTGRIQKHQLRDAKQDPKRIWDFEALGLTVDARDRRAATEAPNF